MSETSKTTAECEAALREFVEITKTDEAVAHFVLQDVDFDLEEAIVRYYSEIDSQAPLPKQIINEVLEAESKESTSKTPAIEPKKDPEPTAATTTKSPMKRKLDQDTNDEPAKQSKIDDHFVSEPAPGSSKEDNKASVAITSSSAADADASETEAKIPPEITVMSYNVDGLDDAVLQTRFLGVLNIVAKVNPEVIFFQEVVAAIEPKLRGVLGMMYNIFSGGTPGMPYYTITAVSKNIEIQNAKIIPYTNTMMGRNMLCVEAKWKDLDIRLINSHLESGWEYAASRKAQFRMAIDKLKQYSTDASKTFALFGGDLNIRDSEVENVPSDIRDVWVAAGADKETKYTWDNKLNDNKGIAKNVRNRFDRFFYKGPYKKFDFRLGGTQRISDVKRFPSDHFAIICKFTLPKTVA